MLEVTDYLTGFDDGGYNRQLSLTMVTPSHIDLEDFSPHFFIPARVFYGALICANTFDGPTLLFLWF